MTENFRCVNKDLEKSRPETNSVYCNLLDQYLSAKYCSMCSKYVEKVKGLSGARLPGRN